MKNAFRTKPEKAGDLNSLEDILGEKMHCLAAILADIGNDIDRRAALSYGVLYDVGRNYRYLKTKLFEMDLWPVNGIRALELRRSGLEKQLDALNQEARQERVELVPRSWTGWQRI